MVDLAASCDELERELAPWARISTIHHGVGGRLVPIWPRRLLARPSMRDTLTRTLSSRRETLLHAEADSFVRAALEELRADAALLLRAQGRLVAVVSLVDLGPWAGCDRVRLAAIGHAAATSFAAAASASPSWRAGAQVHEPGR